MLKQRIKGPTRRYGHGSDGLMAQLGEAYAARGVLRGLVVRDFRLRYKQALLGPAWVVLQPLLGALVFTLVFSTAARSHGAGGSSYILFAFTGLLFWQFIARIIVDGAASLVVNAELVTRMYVPRLLIPAAVVISAALDLLVGLACLFIYCLLLGQPLGWTLLMLPVAIVMAGLLGFGLALWLAPLEALYRDVSRVIPVMVHFLMFLAPVVYPPELVPREWQWLIMLNPAAAVMEFGRFAVLGLPLPEAAVFASWAIVSVGLLFSGFWVFRRLEEMVVEWV